MGYHTLSQSGKFPTPISEIFKPINLLKSWILMLMLNVSYLLTCFVQELNGTPYHSSIVHSSVSPYTRTSTFLFSCSKSQTQLYCWIISFSLRMNIKDKKIQRTGKMHRFLFFGCEGSNRNTGIHLHFSHFPPEDVELFFEFKKLELRFQWSVFVW